MVNPPSKRLIAHPDPGQRITHVESLNDEQLLARFLEDGADSSEEAFRTLVVRHGPMVMSVCRHVLHRHEDAEDAFQATFLALARKADTIRHAGLLAGWLHEVAYRIAIRARSTAARRRDQERQGAAMSASTTPPQHENDVAWTELRPVLHDEINRLPEKYRLPIILSYLEGRSNEEVARLLEWPTGTVKGRLFRARGLLRTRLMRRGLSLSAAFLYMALSQNVVCAEGVPENLIDRTLKRALRARPRATYADGANSPEQVRPAGTSGDSRVDELASLDLRGRNWKPLMRPGLLVLIAVLSVGFAVGSLLHSDNDSSFLDRVKKSVSGMVLGRSSTVCH